jgi:peptide/nickel transport system permease protein
VIGTVVGAYAGFRGGILDNVIMRVAEIFQVFPAMILAALIIALTGAGLSNVVVVIVLLSWPQTARLARNEAMRLKEMDFVYAARCLGHRRAAVLLREIVPNLLAPVIALGTLIVGEAILLEAALSFLGLSAQGDVSWGRMLNEGWQVIFTAWWLSVFPGIAIFLTVLSMNLLGDAFNRRREG